jgi:hypothetical protein
MLGHPPRSQAGSDELGVDQPTFCRFSRGICPCQGLEVPTVDLGRYASIPTR